MGRWDIPLTGGGQSWKGLAQGHQASRRGLPLPAPPGEAAQPLSPEGTLPYSSWGGWARLPLLSKLPRAKQSESGRKHECEQGLPLACDGPSSSSRHLGGQGARAMCTLRPASSGLGPGGCLQPRPWSPPGWGKGRHCCPARPFPAMPPRQCPELAYTTVGQRDGCTGSAPGHISWAFLLPLGTSGSSGSSG